MPKSRVIALLTLFVLSAILTACGNDNDAEGTAEPTATRQPVATIAAADDGTAEAEPAATRDTRTVAVMDASPTIVEVTAATPIPGESTVVAATPATESAATNPVQATFILTGVEQQDFLVTDEGCVGLGDRRGLKPGAQVIVRDASGTVVDVSELQPGESGDGCSWVADLSVPDSEFVSISVPMIADVWFSQSDLGSGMVEITLP